jgi:hypothetical protein
MSSKSVYIYTAVKEANIGVHVSFQGRAYLYCLRICGQYYVFVVYNLSGKTQLSFIFNGNSTLKKQES